jgi:two-component system sensor histidine kinase YesM
MTKLSDLKSKLNIRMSLMVKLIIIFIGLTLIPLILIGILSYSISYNVFLENTTYSTAQIAGQLNKSIDSLFTSVKNLSDIGNESNV